MTSSSQDKVFDTTELLECILLHVDLATLLTSAQRVRRRWHELISDSPELQRHLFFRAIPEQPDKKSSAAAAAALDGTSSTSTRDPEVNPLLKDKFPLFFYEPPAKTDTYSLQTLDTERGLSRSYIRSRYFVQDCDSQTRTFNFASFSRGPGSRDWDRGMPERRLAMAKSEARRAAFLRPGASWRRMLVAQPPPRLVGFFEETATQERSRGREEHRFSELRLDDGLRMGALYDAAVGWVAPYQLCGIVWRPAGLDSAWTVLRGIEGRAGAMYQVMADLESRADVILRLEKSGREGEVVTRQKTRHEMLRRARDEFSRRFSHPEARGSCPSIRRRL
ncbi:F-box-like domain-containing protein [Apiospora hydei]|uniref:F-box-like domain-containing protein n=1 Tax=Apiospora hydei TaxID=1337664 RepID=A0ABR1WC96_9PEZI